MDETLLRNLSVIAKVKGPAERRNLLSTFIVELLRGKPAHTSHIEHFPRRACKLNRSLVSQGALGGSKYMLQLFMVCSQIRFKKLLISHICKGLNLIRNMVG